MAIKNTVSSDLDLRSSIVMSVFECRLSSVIVRCLNFDPSSIDTHVFRATKALARLHRLGSSDLKGAFSASRC